MPARRRQPGVRLGLDRRSGPVGSAFLVDVADDIGRFTSSLAAFEKECWLYHTFNPADNGIHPARPQGSNSLCSWIGCTARSVLVHVVGFVQELEHIGERGQVAIVPVSALGPSFV